MIELNAKRESINMISAVTNQGEVRFKAFEESMNARILIDFMKRLIKSAKRKVILILDNLLEIRSSCQKRVTSHMRMLQKKPMYVHKFFEHNKIAYAA